MTEKDLSQRNSFFARYARSTTAYGPLLKSFGEDAPASMSDLKKNTCVGSCSVLPVGEVLILADLNEPPVLLIPRVPLRS